MAADVGGLALLTQRKTEISRAGVRYSLLGPMRVWRDGDELRLGTPQQQMVLAALLLHGGSTVSMDELIDILWGNHDVPLSAANTVRTYIYRLRLLRRKRSARSIIMSRRGSYAMTVDPAAVDVNAFREHVAAADAARDSGHLDEAANQLQSGLSLWRGPALEGMSTPYFERQRVWLEQLRSGAIENLLSIKIDLGKHTEAVVELTKAIAEQPLRERLWEMYMRALFLAGRRAEALAAYQECRAVLLDQLGLEPGQGLRDVHRLILMSEVMPQANHAASGSASGRLRPRRESRVVEHRSVDTVSSSSLADRLASRLHADYPDGQFIVTLSRADGEPVTPDEVIVDLLRVLHVDATTIVRPLDQLSGLWREVLADRRVLLLLTDAQQRAQILPLLPDMPSSSAVIVTSWATPQCYPTGHVQRSRSPVVLPSGEPTFRVWSRGAPSQHEAPRHQRGTS